jgi:hypothetical protein
LFSDLKKKERNRKAKKEKLVISSIGFHTLFTPTCKKQETKKKRIKQEIDNTENCLVLLNDFAKKSCCLKKKTSKKLT